MLTWCLQSDASPCLGQAAQEMEQILPTSAPASQGGVRGNDHGVGNASSSASAPASQGGVRGKGKGKGGAARPTRSSGRLKGDAPEGSLGRLRPKRAGKVVALPIALASALISLNLPSSWLHLPPLQRSGAGSGR